MELYEAVNKIINTFGTDILSDRKFVNMLMDYFHFDVPAKKRIVTSLIEDGQLKKLVNYGDFTLVINDISNYEYRINGYNEDLTRDVLIEISKGIKKKTASNKKISEKAKANSNNPKSFIHKPEDICIVSVLDIIKGVYYPTKGFTCARPMDYLSVLFNERHPCYKADKLFVKEKYSEACDIYKEYLKNDYTCSLRLAFCYLHGSGVPIDYSQAMREFGRNADSDCIAQYGKGLLYELRHKSQLDYVSSVKWYLKSAENGFSPSQTNLGICYFFGKGVAVDYKEAVKWFKKAVRQGNACAQAYLGICYFKGLGVRKNVNKAIQLFMISSDQHHHLGEYYMGECYENGIGVMQSKVEAIKLYKASAAHGYEDATKRLAGITKK